MLLNLILFVLPFLRLVSALTNVTAVFGDSRIITTGVWTESDTGCGYYTSTQKSMVSLKFIGVSIHVLGDLTLYGGKVRVTLDGQPVRWIDLYGTSSCGQVIFSSTSLANGQHSINLELTEEKSPNVIRIDGPSRFVLKSFIWTVAPDSSSTGVLSSWAPIFWKRQSSLLPPTPPTIAPPSPPSPPTPPTLPPPTTPPTLPPSTPPSVPIPAPSPAPLSSTKLTTSSSSSLLSLSGSSSRSSSSTTSGSLTSTSSRSLSSTSSRSLSSTGSGSLSSISSRLPSSSSSRSSSLPRSPPPSKSTTSESSFRLFLTTPSPGSPTSSSKSKYTIPPTSTLPSESCPTVTATASGPTQDISGVRELWTCKPYGSKDCVFNPQEDAGQNMYSLIIGAPASNCGGTTDSVVEVGGQVTISDTWSQDATAGLSLGESAGGLVLNTSESQLWGNTQSQSLSRVVKMTIPPERQGALVAQVTYNSTNGTLQIGNETPFHVRANQPRNDVEYMANIVPCDAQFNGNYTPQFEVSSPSAATKSIIPYCRAIVVIVALVDSILL